MVERDAYEPCAVMTRWALERGLDDPGLDAVLRDLRDKHGLRPHTLDWWDERWLRFVETAARPRQEARPEPDMNLDGVEVQA